MLNNIVHSQLKSVEADKNVQIKRNWVILDEDD